LLALKTIWTGSWIINSTITKVCRSPSSFENIRYWKVSSF